MIKGILHNQKKNIYVLSVLLIAFITYFHNYHKPASVFWDENYHIASASKYIDGVMYMETHPPLGKLFISLGEYMLNPNSELDTSHFSKTDYIKKFPQTYSFAGVRLFPALFGTFASVLFFLILYRISKNLHLSFLFSSFYLFANAFILQSRSAMLESSQIFFIFLSVYYFLVLFDKNNKTYKEYFYLGILMGLAISVKVNGLIIILLYPFLYFYKTDVTYGIYYHIKHFIFYGLSLSAGIIIIFSAIFYLHVSLGSSLGFKTYKASSTYQEIIQKNQTSNIIHFPLMLKENIMYIYEYSKKVPRYDPCKKGGENGSIATTWPFGNKSINYRWHKKNGKVSYLYLQSNPIIWFSVVLSIILASSLVIGRAIYNIEIKDKRLFYLIAAFLSIYFSYLLVMFNAGRVMYLYHYFIPLFFGIFILFLLYNYIFKEEIEKNNMLLKYATYLLVIEVIYVYWYFSVFTYYKPITTIEFMNREWFDFWRLKVIL